jgi:large subunit ribosomal protein L17
MTASLFRYERIKTTKAKALEVRRDAEKMITRAKEDSVHNRRIVGKDIKDQEVLAKLFTDIGPRYKERPGGYTRILKLGNRQGDAAEMVLLELVSEAEEEPKKGKKKAKKAEKQEKAAAPAEKKEETAPESAEEPSDEEGTENSSGESKE